jgi:hypothetical protein
MSDKNREAFEKWANSTGKNETRKHPNGQYYAHGEIAWEAFQACAAEKDAEIERLRAMLETVKAGQRDHADVSRRRGDEIARLQRVVEVLRKGYQPLLSGELPDGDIVEVCVSTALYIESVIAAAQQEG